MKSVNTNTLIILALLLLAGFFIVPKLTFLTPALAFVVGVVLTFIVCQLDLPTKSSIANTNPSSPAELTTLYIGNLPYRSKEASIKLHFEQYGYVDSVRLLKDRRTGKPKGFGFVEVASDAANKMIKKLNDTTFEERTLKVRLAKEKVED